MDYYTPNGTVVNGDDRDEFLENYLENRYSVYFGEEMPQEELDRVYKELDIIRK
jgi:hypothetical protein